MSGLDSGLRGRLADIARGRGLGGDVPSYFVSRHRPGRLVLMLVIGLGLAGAGVAATASVWFEATPPSLWVRLVVSAASGLAVCWMFVCVLELVRAAASPVKPFLLLTPKVLLVADYAHGDLEGYRLKDATGFKKVETYDDKQNHAGLRFDFTFPDGAVQFVVKDAGEIQRLEAALALARQGGELDPGTSGESLLPSSGGGSKSGGLRGFTRPTGEFWLVVLAFGIIGAILLFILARILGK